MRKWYKVIVSKERLRKDGLFPESAATPEWGERVCTCTQGYTPCVEPGPQPMCCFYQLGRWWCSCFCCCCFGNSRCLGSVTCQNGQKIHQNEIWVSNHGRLCTQGALNSWPTLLCLTHRDIGCSCASLPQQCSGAPTRGKGPTELGFLPF